MPSSFMQSPRGASSVERKRTLRKGTFSCWECKRRKRRCDLGAHPTAACSWCQQRGLDCVGQDHDDTCQVGMTHVEGRLDEIEVLVSRFIQQRYGCRKRSFTRAQLEASTGRTRIFVTPESLLSTPEAQSVRCRELGGYIYSILPQLDIIKIITTRGRSVFRRHLGMHDDPIAVLQEPMVQPPHLLLAARKLFQLSLCLRQMQFIEHEDNGFLSELGGSPHEIADRYATAASYVTSQDFLVQSIEGLDTLMMQAYSHIHTGDAAGMQPILSCALTNGQRLGIDKAMDPYNEIRWFHIVYAERFLALGLGKPAFAIDTHIASDKLLATSQITRRLERIHVLIAERVISRNLHLQQCIPNIHGDKVSHSSQEASEQESPSLVGLKKVDVENALYKETQDLDHQLKQAAKCVSITWWTPLCLNSTDDDTLMGRISHMLTQLHHHYLLILIHQPFIVDSKGTVQHHAVDYSRQVGMNASREVLTRFVLFKSITYVPCAFVGMGQKAFAASITLLLLHIAGHKLGSQANPLEHQRPQDLCLIEQNLDALEAIFSSANTDSGYGDVGALKTLMEIEAEASFGTRYSTWMESSNSTRVNEECTVAEPVLKIPIPYHGHVCIVKSDASALHTIIALNR